MRIMGTDLRTYILLYIYIYIYIYIYKLKHFQTNVGLSHSFIKVTKFYKDCDNHFKMNYIVDDYSLSPGVWQSFVTIRSCNHLMRIISTYVDNTKKSEIS